MRGEKNVRDNSEKRMELGKRKWRGKSMRERKKNVWDDGGKKMETEK